MDRFYCPDCHKCFTRLPSYLLPYKRYTAAEIETGLQHVAAGKSLSQAPGEVDESTLRRWIKEFGGKMRDWAGQLESILLRLKQYVASVIRLPLNQLHRLQSILAEYPVLPSHWTLLVKALYWLQKSHPHCLG